MQNARQFLKNAKDIEKTDPPRSLTYYRQALVLNPTNAKLRKKIESMEEKERKRKEKVREEMQKELDDGDKSGNYVV